VPGPLDTLSVVVEFFKTSRGMVIIDYDYCQHIGLPPCGF